eukprot:3490759-Pyramimonas_sp.AAC.1
MAFALNTLNCVCLPRRYGVGGRVASTGSARLPARLQGEGRVARWIVRANAESTEDLAETPVGKVGAYVYHDGQPALLSAARVCAWET